MPLVQCSATTTVIPPSSSGEAWVNFVMHVEYFYLIYLCYCVCVGFRLVCSPLEALRTRLGETGQVNYAKGCDIDSEDTSGFEEALVAVRSSSEVVVAVGIDQSQEKEGRDREQIVSYLLSVLSACCVYIRGCLPHLPHTHIIYIHTYM
jgi:hypothetical protein